MSFGSEDSTSETLQAQQGFTNDTPVDVNFNAVIARTQAQTTQLSGSEFEAASARRTNASDAATERRQIMADKLIV